MTVERLKQLAEAYGSDLRRWPVDARLAMEALRRDDPVAAERLLFEAAQMDVVLDASRPWPVSVALRDRVVASAVAAGLTPRKARAALGRLAWVFGAGWAAAACAGVVAGTNLTLHLSRDAQADAVLYQSSLSGVDDAEVLG